MKKCNNIPALVEKIRQLLNIKQQTMTDNKGIYFEYKGLRINLYNTNTYTFQGDVASNMDIRSQIENIAEEINNQ